MANPTHCYCDYATGNDYKGATFTDGVYTDSTKNLNKTGAFTASQVNHWLYLSGTGITTGYYKIATKTDNDNVILATDAGSDSSAVTCTQADGTTTKPWRSIQGALDLITRDATNGDQINVKAGTAQVNQAALTLATYGTSPTSSAPLIIRGYTSAANDGGNAEIDANGATFWAATNYPFFHLVDLTIHNFGNNNGIVSSSGQPSLIRCKVHKGASTPSSKSLISLTVYGRIVGCHVYDAGTSGVGADIRFGHAYGNYFYNCATGLALQISSAVKNIFVDCTVGIGSAAVLGASLIADNTFYSSTANTGSAISNTNTNNPSILNNVIEGYSGTGGKGITNTSGNDIVLLGYNAFYNNATNESFSGDVFVDLGGDQTLTASPFVNAGAGDFSLTATGGALETAWPGAWYGPASTTNKADMGAVQKGAGVSGPPGWL